MKEKLIWIIRDIIHEECEITSETELLSSGILDSIGIVELVLQIESEYSIEIDGDDIDPENFKNLNAISTMINNYLK